MTSSSIKEDILRKIRDIAKDNNGKPPGSEKFQSETGVKPHLWRGKLWRSWSDALVEAGFEPNVMQGRLDDESLLFSVCEIARMLDRFPTTGDIAFEFNKRPELPHPDVVFGRWKMIELARAVSEFAISRDDSRIAELSREYLIARQDADVASGAANSSPSDALGHVYLQRHGNDFKIGFTRSLNKRGRQIQIELPQEIELIHAILTDDPVGVEGYWHRRFADKRTRGEWFKLTKADIAAFKKWSKIW